VAGAGALYPGSRRAPIPGLPTARPAGLPLCPGWKVIS